MSLEDRCDFSLIRKYDSLYKDLTELRRKFVPSSYSTLRHESFEQQEAVINIQMAEIYDILVKRTGSIDLLDKCYEAQHKYLGSLTNSQLERLTNVESKYILSNGANNELNEFLTETCYPTLSVIRATQTFKELAEVDLSK